MTETAKRETEAGGVRKPPATHSYPFVKMTLFRFTYEEPLYRKRNRKEKAASGIWKAIFAGERKNPSGDFLSVIVVFFYRPYMENFLGK